MCKGCASAMMQNGLSLESYSINSAYEAISLEATLELARAGYYDDDTEYMMSVEYNYDLRLFDLVFITSYHLGIEKSRFATFDLIGDIEMVCEPEEVAVPEPQPVQGKVIMFPAAQPQRQRTAQGA